MKRKLLIINCSTHQWPHMPVGTNGISFLLKKNQVKHTVLSYHNQNRRETYEVLRSLIRSGYDVILLFHWKEQIKTFFELSRYIKYFKNKNSVLCAAGMSAGFFYKQILLDENLPDLVFIGDSEKSIIDFSKNIPIEKISNIAYIDKKNKKIIKTKSQDHSMDTKTFSNITYTYFENIYNKSNYINFIFCNTCFYINLSRGCDKKCLYCGGSIIAFKHCSGRNHSVYRNINSVINDIVYLFKKNKNIFKNNPVPIFIDDFFDNYILVLKKLSDINLSPMINIVINERGLLDKEKLIKNISVFYSFNKVSFEVSPETELDYQRKKLMPDNTRNMYKNEYLIKLICFLREHNFYCSVYYTMFNSFDTKNDILNRLNFIREMKFKYEDEYIKFDLTSFSIDPGSIYYNKLKHPPDLYDYLNNRSNGKFCNLLGNLTYLKRKDEIDYFILSSFYLQIINDKRLFYRILKRKDLNLIKILDVIRKFKLKNKNTEFLKSFSTVEYILSLL